MLHLSSSINPQIECGLSSSKKTWLIFAFKWGATVFYNESVTIFLECASFDGWLKKKFYQQRYWFCQQRLDDLNELNKILKKDKIICISGKGKNYFNIAIIKPDTCFCDHLIRAQVDASKDTRCVFPSI